MNRFSLVWGALLGGTGVMIGAFGAHALRATLEASGRSDTFETAVKYQFYHALALLLIGILAQHYPGKALQWAGMLMVAGVLIFSGSLYVLCLSGIRWLGAVTPIGGVLLIAGWMLMLIGVTRG